MLDAATRSSLLARNPVLTSSPGLPAAHRSRRYGPEPDPQHVRPISLHSTGPLLLTLLAPRADKGFTVAAYNRTTSKVDHFLENEAKGALSFIARPAAPRRPGTVGISELTAALRSQASPSSAPTRSRSSARSSRRPGRSSCSSRRETPSTASSPSSSRSSRRATSSLTAETRTSPTRTGARPSLRRRVSCSSDRESLEARRAPATAPA